MKYAERIRVARLQLVADALGTAAVLKFWNGPVPSSCEAADPLGSPVAEIDLPPIPLTRIDGSVLSLTEPWVGYGNRHSGKGTLVRCFRIYNGQGECVIQGDCTAPEDGGDLVLDPPTAREGQKISIGAFVIKELGET